ncbi:MAG: hypothetical protein A2Z97_07505 [Bdellovibrionales bacterium GWB1_52_6]|nr:MAG: hypothetical protein A2Z97_07505 [Bdellovibrionales bacterium GWB1_52_6]OFZ04729.1 MAG: hypothetical protein A2X97_13455 [Bdellovibrionales bacterium GWA1_52_35]HCM39540.1 hypothetical protein [Bdellovibrionales bacterium]
MRLFLFAAAIWSLTPLYVNSSFAWSDHERLFTESLQPQLEFLPPLALMHLGPALDEPDGGMDRDLPASADPENERKWMGGTEGFSSQGFRHMYFGGWKFTNPVATFQIPFKALGQAPNRVQETAREARELFKNKEFLSAVRKLGWSLHYLEDLAQPFHSTQLVHWKMAKWSALAHWPISDAMSHFIDETTRTISNYHLAMEGYVEHVLRQPGIFAESPLNKALQDPESFASVRFDSKLQPKALALELARASVALAPELGEAEMAFFGEQYLEPAFDLRKDLGIPDYQAYATRPDLAGSRARFEKVIAKALANGVLASRALVEWTLHP